MNEDHYIEFYNYLDSFLYEHIKKIQYKQGIHITTLGLYNVQHVMKKELFMRSIYNQWREEYEYLRKKGFSSEKAFILLEKKHLSYSSWKEHKHTEIQDFKKHIWYNTLQPYRGQIIIYIQNKRHLNYLELLIRKMTQTVILLTENELPEETDLPDNVTAFCIDFIRSGRCENFFLEKYFPQTYIYYNVFDWIVGILNPKAIIFLEGGVFQEHVLALVSHHFQIPSFCIQHGWPSFLHTMFREMPYTYFLTWGAYFIDLWKKYNTQPIYEPVGYMYPIAKEDKQRKGITFFLQAPVFLSNPIYLSQMIKLIKTVALQFPNLDCMIKEHPTYKLPANIKEKLAATGKIRFVTDIPLDQVFAQTLFSVSHFSSASMESILHHCIPLIFDPTNESFYHPHIEIEGWGIIAKNIDDFIHKLQKIISTKTVIFEMIQKAYPTLIKTADGKTLDNMIKFINKHT